MYQIVVSFTVAPDHHDGFVAAAARVAQESTAHEPGSLRFEVLTDADDPNVFHLSEAYADADAFRAHAAGPYFARFFETASRVAEGPVWRMKGTTVG